MYLNKLQVILIVGTKLQVIITKLGLRIQEKGDVVKGTPLVQPGDHLFWLGRPRFILFLVHLVLFTVIYINLTFLFSSSLHSTAKKCLKTKSKPFFLDLQNAFQLAFFAWSTVSKYYILHKLRLNVIYQFYS